MVAILFGTAGTLVPTGTVFSVTGNPDATFETISDVTLIAGTDEVQDITFGSVPTAGTFKLFFDGEETATIPFSATASTVESALEALSTVTDVSVSGSFAAGFTVTFDGAGMEKRNQPLLVVTENLLTDPAPYYESLLP